MDKSVLASQVRVRLQRARQAFGEHTLTKYDCAYSRHVLWPDQACCASGKSYAESAQSSSESGKQSLDCAYSRHVLWPDQACCASGKSYAESAQSSSESGKQSLDAAKTGSVRVCEASLQGSGHGLC